MHHRERLGGPGDGPVVGMDHVGRPAGERADELHEVVVRRRGGGHDEVVGDPRQPDRCRAGTRTSPSRWSLGELAWRGVSTTTSWPARPSARARPSTWAASPPTAWGGKSHASKSTRMPREVTAGSLRAQERAQTGATSRVSNAPTGGPPALRQRFNTRMVEGGRRDRRVLRLSWRSATMRPRPAGEARAVRTRRLAPVADPKGEIMRSRKRSLSIVAAVALAAAGIGVAQSAGATTAPPGTEPAGTAAVGTEAAGTAAAGTRSARRPPSRRTRRPSVATPTW